MLPSEANWSSNDYYSIIATPVLRQVLPVIHQYSVFVTRDSDVSVSNAPVPGLHNTHPPSWWLALLATHCTHAQSHAHGGYLGFLGSWASCVLWAHAVCPALLVVYLQNLVVTCARLHACLCCWHQCNRPQPLVRVEPEFGRGEPPLKFAHLVNGH